MVTMFIILISVFMLGSLTSKALKFFGIDTDIDEEKYVLLLNEADVPCQMFHRYLSRICLDRSQRDYYALRDSLAEDSSEGSGSMLDLARGRSSTRRGSSQGFSMPCESRVEWEDGVRGRQRGLTEHLIHQESFDAPNWEAATTSGRYGRVRSRTSPISRRSNAMGRASASARRKSLFDFGGPRGTSLLSGTDPSKFQHC